MSHVLQETDKVPVGEAAPPSATLTSSQASSVRVWPSVAGMIRMNGRGQTGRGLAGARTAADLDGDHVALQAAGCRPSIPPNREKVAHEGARRPPTT